MSTIGEKNTCHEEVDLVLRPALVVAYPPFCRGPFFEHAIYLASLKNPLPIESNAVLIPASWTVIYSNFDTKNAGADSLVAVQKAVDVVVTATTTTKPRFFTTVAHDDGVFRHKLPTNTVVFGGGGTGNIPLPLWYPDAGFLEAIPRKTWAEKSVLVSFVGSLTHPVRTTMCQALQKAREGVYLHADKWSMTVAKDAQQRFLTVSTHSKFIMCPRGYGRTSYRLIEALRIGCVPVYVWDDIEWLPYKDLEVGDFSWDEIAISVNIRDIDMLHARLAAITEKDYAQMQAAWQRQKHRFTPDGMWNYVRQKMSEQ